MVHPEASNSILRMPFPIQCGKFLLFDFFVFLFFSFMKNKDSGSVTDHVVEIDADKYTPMVIETSIPSGLFIMSINISSFR